MKKRICLLIFSACIVCCKVVPVFAQADSASEAPGWEFNAAANFYFIPDDFFVLPVFRADKNKLHLEARYNYEDRETFSGWIGYNFKGGNNFEYAITPMVGGVVGLSNGMAPGVEITLNFKGFELYNESEYYFDFKSSENSFFYSWTDVTYSATEWLWFGISGQRIRSYQSELDLQRGILIGAGLKEWELNTYFYNPGKDNSFFLISLSKGF